MKNPKWHRDEIILALDLYFRLEPGQISSRNPRIVELSELLNKLPIHEIRPDKVKFRNPNGASLKLSNFLAIDPAYHGKGMEAFSKLDKEVFDEFNTDRERLAQLADKIKRTVSNTKLNLQLYKIQDEDDNENKIVKEGRVIYKLHKYRERNSKINQKKKDLYFKEHGKLICEVCAFNFYEDYGKIGKGFMECHHRIPLSAIDAEVNTKLSDLALVCSNCHRMLHREIDTLDILELKRRRSELH